MSDAPDGNLDERDDVFGDDDDGIDDEIVGGHKWIFPVVAVLVVVGFAIAIFLVLRGSDSAKAVGPEGVPIQNVPDLAPAASTADGRPVNGITCRSSMGQQVVFHIHQHVNIFVNGEQRRLPAGVGITKPWWVQQIDGFDFVNNSVSSCVYWLHTHATDGIIHLESPAKRSFTLGDFFDVWQQPLSATQVGPAKGKVTAFVNGKRYVGNPRGIPLTDDGVIQLSVGEPVVPYKDLEFTVKNVCGDGTLSCSPTDSAS